MRSGHVVVSQIAAEDGTGPNSVLPAFQNHILAHIGQRKECFNSNHLKKIHDSKTNIIFLFMYDGYLSIMEAFTASSSICSSREESPGFSSSFW